MVACDPWCFCLDDSLLDRSTGQQGQEGTPPPVLCLLSEEWVGNKERFAVDALLRATHRRGRLRACYEMPGTVHQSASDTPLWLPGRLAERLRMKGHGEDGGRTHRAAAEAIHEQVVAAASREAGAAAAASPQSSLRFGGVAARYPDQLREFTGWVLQR